MFAKRAVFAILCVVVLAACGAQPTPETVIQTVKETVPVIQTGNQASALLRRP
jgi:hypothetical protein